MAWKRLGVVALQELAQSYSDHIWKPIKKAGYSRADVTEGDLYEIDIELKAKGIFNLVELHYKSKGIDDFYNFLQSYLYAHNSRGHCKRDLNDCTPSRFYISFFNLNNPLNQYRRSVKKP